VTPPVALHLDRPFLVQIAHTQTGWPLFLAAVRDPRH
jgi:serine protease inhibitor